MITILTLKTVLKRKFISTRINQFRAYLDDPRKYIVWVKHQMNVYRNFTTY